MAEPTEIEKKSLEAHVELCAERYRYLEEKLEIVDSNIKGVKSDITSVKEMIAGITEKRNNQLISWGVGIIAFMAAIIGYLISNYIFK